MSLALSWHMGCDSPPPIGDLKPKSYIGTANKHAEGEPVRKIDWSAKDPFEGMETVICWTCEGIEEEMFKCRTCRAQGKVLVYAA